MSRWNPNAPNTIGLEWVAPLKTQETLDRVGKCAYQALASSTTETINNLTWGVSNNPARPSATHVTEVFISGHEAPANVQTLTMNPDTASDFPTGSLFLARAFSGQTLVQCLAVGPGAVGFILSTQAATVSYPVSSVPTGKRIIAVGFNMGIASAAPYGSLALWLGHAPDFSGNRDMLLRQTINSTGTGVGGTNLGSVWESELCPWTMQPWTNTDIMSFASGGAWHPYVRYNSWTYRGYTFVDWLQLYVIIADDNRIAWGSTVFTPDASNVANTVLYNGNTDLTSTGWPKVAGTNYSIVCHRPLSSSGNVSPSAGTGPFAYLTYLGGGDIPVPASGTMLMNAAGTLQPGWVTDGRAYAVCLATNAPANSVDSLSYNTLAGQGLDTVLSTALSQTITPTTTETYGLLTMLFSTAPGTRSSIIVTISHGAGVVDATFTTTADTVFTDATLQPSGLYLVLLPITTPVTLTAGTTYTVSFTQSLPATNDDQWTVYYLDTQLTLDSNPVDASSGFGGAASAGSPGPMSDVMVTLVVAPPAPTSLAGVVNTQTLTVFTKCVPVQPSDAVVQGIEYTALSWIPTSIGSAFAHYEIQRSDDVDPTNFQMIAAITNEAVTAFNDFEARTDIQSYYRLRSVRTDGAISLWTSTVSTQIAGDDSALLFTTNEAPELNVGYIDIYSTGSAAVRQFAFNDAANVATLQLYGRDYSVSFRPLETAGDTFTRTLSINALAPVLPPTKSRFEPLIDITRAGTSYVCVKDSRGNRWFASLTVAKADMIEASYVYQAEITVTESTGTPSPVDVT